MENCKSKENIMVKPLHVGISVPDMEKAVKWYQDMLGFSPVSDKFFEQLPARIVFLDHGDFSIELFEVPGAAPLPQDRRIPNLDIRTHGTKHIAYRVEDLTSLMETLKAKGVDVAMDLFPMEGDLVAFIRDVAGNLIELIQQNVRI